MLSLLNHPSDLPVDFASSTKQERRNGVTMDTGTKSIEGFYDEKYRGGHYFKYRDWLYQPFIKALINKADVSTGSLILDLGCGQGFFTKSFSQLGLKALGVDVSAEAVRSAEANFDSTGAKFETGDVLSLPYKATYDCVFVRGLSLYNSKDFERQRNITDTFLDYLKSDGVMIFSYCTNFSPRMKSTGYIHHSLEDARKHFAVYVGAKVYFSLRIETLLLGRMALCSPLTLLCKLASRFTGIGGELVAFVPRSSLKKH